MTRRRWVAPVAVLLALAGLVALAVLRAGEQPPSSAPTGREGNPATVSAPANRAGPTDAEFDAHVRGLRDRLPEGFTLCVARPFVVLGDEDADTVRRRADGTVRWAVDLLRKDFFEKDPAEIIDIWLFRDKASYTEHAAQLFGDAPDTPFGYYSARHQALVMNIRTGGGTLVHEIVHPFMRANFPACPSWFDEGLASLYEQSGERDGHIVGYTNWRLAGLQKAIRAGKALRFERLCGLTRDEFYGEGSGLHYAQARYLCYWLQQHGRLVKFYHAFVAVQKDDPTGYKTLVRILGEDDMDAFQTRWQAWVLKLRYP